MQRLQADILPEIDAEAGRRFQKNSGYPVKILQFGEGNFLRAFVDWMIDILNEKTDFGGRVRIIQPLAQGLVESLNQQSGLYTVVPRGIRNGVTVEDRRIICSVEKGINPYEDPEEFLASARLEELRFVVSNTTEAGIVYREGESIDDIPPSSFPGKVVQLLHTRYTHFKGDPEKGLVFIPCELIDKNGATLRKIIMRLIDEWEMEYGFRQWVLEHNTFMNSLVDRIVPGYPQDEMEEWKDVCGYEDRLIDTCEDFHLWVIEGDSRVKEELPLVDAGLNVVWTNDLSVYRTRKVRILNGIHTMTCLTAYLYGLETVGECLENTVVRRFIDRGLREEILPNIDSIDGVSDYADAVLERFANPFILHKLLSISLNSISKFKTRVLPSLLETADVLGAAPPILCFSLAGLMDFFRPEEMIEGKYLGRRGEDEYPLMENPENLIFMADVWQEYPSTPEGAVELCRRVLSHEVFWGRDLTQISKVTERTAAALYAISRRGMCAALESLVSEGEV